MEQVATVKATGRIAVAWCPLLSDIGCVHGGATVDESIVQRMSGRCTQQVLILVNELDPHYLKYTVS